MKLPLLLALSLLLILPAALAETADDYFHGGAVNYLSNNIPRALEVVTNGRALFPDDIKLQKLEELLKQQNQQQEQQQNEQQQQQEEKEQQSKDDKEEKQKQEENQSQQEKKEQEQQQQQQQSKESGDESKQDEKQQPMTAHAMTPEEANQLLDAQKGDEKVLQFAPEGERKNPSRILKDW